jgi:hypothetical protein
VTKSDTLCSGKKCKVCGAIKPLDEFYKASGTRDGRRGDCKACNLAKRAAKYRENPNAYIDRVKRWQEENPERYQKRQQEYRDSGKKAIADRKSYLKRTYGMSIEQFDAMLEAQGGACAICRQPRPDERTLHVDHDHATGAIRGLLCFKCNNALGDFDDSLDLFTAATNYLDRDDELDAVIRARALALSAQPS